MKKRILFVLFMVLLNSLYAQEGHNQIEKKTAFGVKVGSIRGYIDRVDKSLLNGIQGLYGGVYVTTRFHKKWSFQNEVDFTITNGYLFIEIPAVLKYHINDKWSFFAGPKLDILLNDDVRYYSDTHFKTLGISADVGIQFNISKRVFIEARYSYSFTKQITFDYFPSNNRQTFRVGIGYRF